METIVISKNDLARYNELKQNGYRVQWVGEGKICFVLK